MTVERDEGFRAGVARDEAARALEVIRGHADADDPTSYRSDDREGCLDAIYAEADRALKYIALLPANAGQSDGGVEERIVRWVDQAIERAEEHGNTEDLWLTADMWRVVRQRLVASAPAAREGE